MLRVAKIIGVILIALFAVLAFNAWRAGESPPAKATDGLNAEIDANAVAGRLAELLKFKTISVENQPHANAGAFHALHAWLAKTYPSTHATLTLEIVNGESLLFTWPGRDTDLAPIALLAHMDVVPVQDETIAMWTHPPFAGTVADGFVWGRGALDMKSTLLGLMEATEWLTERGITPARTVYIALGHDEEVSGYAGAGEIAKLLEARGVRLAWTLDEGGMVLDDALPGLDRPVAMISIAEKGYASLEIVARAEGGHSSVPPPETAVGRLAKALVAIETQPYQPKVSGVFGEMLERIGAASPFAVRLVTANRWLFDPIIARALSFDTTLSAMTRTTTAATMLRASPQDNVLAQEAVGTVNFRIFPGETPDSVRERTLDLVRDLDVDVRFVGPISAPSPVSATDNAAFAAIERSVSKTFPDALIVPGLMMAATDSRRYVSISDDSYRFAGNRLGTTSTSLFHGTDERIAVDALGPLVAFYIELMGGDLGAEPRLAEPSAPHEAR